MNNMYYTLQYVFDTIRKLLGYKRRYDDRGDSREYGVIDDVNFTAIFANSLKNLAITDSNIEVTGTSDRAEYLNAAVKRLRRDLSKITSYILGYGGCVVIPYATERGIFFDVVNHNQDHFQIEKMEGDTITDCAILADRIPLSDNNTVFYRFVHFTLNKGTLVIRQIAKKNALQVPLKSVEEWANIPEIEVIQNAKAMPFVYFKNPKDSRLDSYNKGVSITYGSEKYIKEAKETMQQVSDEFKYKQSRIFLADNMLLDEHKNLSKEYMLINSGSSQSFIEVFSPDIRESSYYNRLMQVFALLEKSVGTSAGILTPQASRGATATEIKASLQDTFAIITDLHEELTTGINKYVEACNMLCNYYGLTALGDYEVKCDWSYALIESSEESFNQLMQAQSIGAVSLAEVRQFVKPQETIEQAQEAIDNIKATEPTIKQTLGLEAV